MSDAEPTRSERLRAVLTKYSFTLWTSPDPDARPLRFLYRNHRGEVATRTVWPKSVRFGTTEWHPKPQWFLSAFDIDRNADRDFAIQDMVPAPEVDVSIQPPSEAERLAACIRDALRNLAIHENPRLPKKARRQALDDARAFLNIAVEGA